MVTRRFARIMPMIGWSTLVFACFWVIGGSLIDSGEYFVGDAVTVLAFTAVGALVVSRQPRNWAGILFLTPVFVAVSYVAEAYARAASDQSLPGEMLAWWLSGWIWMAGVWPVSTVLPLVLPDGKLPHRFWRPAAWLIITLFGVLIVIGPFVPASLDRPPNPVGISSLVWVTQDGAILIWFLFLTSALVGLASLVHRLVLSKGRARAQLLWIGLGAWVMVLYKLLEAGLGGPLELVLGIGAALALPVACGIAILRYDLVVLNPLLRQLVLYVLLATVCTTMFLLVRLIVGAGALVATSSAVGLALIAPHLRRWLGRRVSRLVYGKRGSPMEILTDLRQRLANAATPDDVLSALADSVARALPVDAASVILTSAHRELRRISCGDGDSSVDQTHPLRFQGLELGRIEINSCGIELDNAERSLLAELASTAAPAVAAAHRAEELQRAREQLVVAREQERRRIARDLHDGLGAVLSGAGFTLDALRQSIEVAGASGLLATRARAQLREASHLVRRVVRELRPTLLDQLGLVCAISELAARHTGPSLLVEVNTGDLGELTAATEVAAFAIAAEALTNVARHASASRCDITLSREGDVLRLIVEDDGIGIQSASNGRGLGLTSMAERATELGGECYVRAREGGGIVVHAELPAQVGCSTTHLEPRPAEVKP